MICAKPIDPNSSGCLGDSGGEREGFKDKDKLINVVKNTLWWIGFRLQPRFRFRLKPIFDTAPFASKFMLP